MAAAVVEFGTSSSVLSKRVTARESRVSVKLLKLLFCSLAISLSFRTNSGSQRNETDCLPPTNVLIFVFLKFIMQM